MSSVAYRWIDSDAALEEVIDALLTQTRYAIDTEFHRERTYYPALALVQICWPDDLVLIDPLAVDVSAMKRLFDSEVQAVFHAAQQDLDVLTHAVGTVPRRFFDTQIAGGFVGYGTPSLVSLLQGEMGITVPKGDRLTDWLRRPLSEEQMVYAASDVVYLLQTQDQLLAQLATLGRLEWAEAACRELALKPTSGLAPFNAWERLKDSRSLRPKARAIAQAVAAWREQTAMSRNVPVRQVLPDLAILGIAQRRPANEKELKQARGVDERFSRGKLAQEILAAVESARDLEPPDQLRGSDDLERELRPAVTLISAWVSQVAKAERIDTAMLATRTDLTELLAGEPNARLRTGWRAELLGDGVERLLAGTAGLTFDRQGGLRLVDIAAAP